MYKATRYYLPKGFIKNYIFTINGKKLHDQPIDSDIKWYKEIRQLTVWQGEDYTTGCLADYDYVENRYRLKALDLSRVK